MVNRSKTIILLFLVLAALAVMVLPLPPADAAIEVETYYTTEGFFISGSQAPMDLCSCQSFTDSFTITNTGMVPVTLSLSSSFPARFSEQTVEIQPQQSHTVAYTLDVACSFLEYSNPLTITASSSTGRMATFERALNVGKCQNLAAEALISAGRTVFNPCENITGTLTIQNIGTFPDVYSFSLDSGPGSKWLNTKGGKNANALKTFFMKQPGFTLDAGAFEKIPFTIVPDCTYYGNTSMIFQVSSKKNGLSVDIPLDFEITPSYPYSLRFPEATQVCAEDSKNVYVSLTNDAGFQNSYKLAYSVSSDLASDLGKQFVTWPEETSYSVQSEEEKIIFINLFPKRGHEGNYTLKIGAISGVGNIEKSATMPIIVSSCYSGALTISNYTGPAPSLEGRICSGSVSYKVNVKNTGAFTETFNLGSEGADFLKLSKKSLSLAPGEEKSVTLSGQLPDVTQDYHVRVFATLSSNKAFSEAEVDISVIDQKSCHEIVKEGDKLTTIRFEQANIPVKIATRSSRDETYMLSLHDPSETSWLSLDRQNISLGSNSSAWINILSDPNNETKEGTYTVMVRAIPMSNNDIEYLLPVRVEVSQWPLIVRAYRFLDNHLCTQLSVLLSILAIVVFAVLLVMKKSAFTKKFKKEHRISLKILIFLLLIFVIALIVLVTAIHVPQHYSPLPATDENDDELTFTWYQGDSYVVDLGRYFYSPEQEQMAFSASKQDNIAVSFDKNDVTFTPVPGYFGETMIKITATDQYNESTESPFFMLRVIPVQEPVFTEYILGYCEVFNIFIAGIIFFLVYLIVLFRKRENVEK